MNKRYQELFTISMQHPYYNKGVAMDLSVEPNAATQNLLRKFDLVWRKTAEGKFSMFFGRESGQAAPLSLLGAQALQLRFVLRSTNPYFINFTKLDFKKFNSEKLFFSNLNPFPGPNYDPAFLSQTPIAGDADLLPVQTPVFDINTPAKQPFPILDFFGNPLPLLYPKSAPWDRAATAPAVIWEDWPPLKPGEGSHGAFRVDISDFPSGKYALEKAVDDRNWFFKPAADFEAPSLGVVDIYVGNAQAQMVQLPPKDAADAFVAPSYQIQFESRATKWRYFLIRNGDLQLERMELLDGKDPFPFKIGGTDLKDIAFETDSSGWRYFLPGETNAVEAELLRSGNQRAVPVVSVGEFPLREQPPMKPLLRLIQKSKTNGTTELSTSINLPVPDWRITPVGAQVFSDMYIYL